MNNSNKWLKYFDLIEERTIIESGYKNKSETSGITMRNIYPKGNNPFAGGKVINFKRTFTYPNEGDVRFQIQLDKNNQVCEIRQSFAQVIKDAETKKRFVKITLGDRPRILFDKIKGRPFAHAEYWIDNYIENLGTSEEVDWDESEEA